MLYYIMKGLIYLEENYYDILEVNKNASQEIIEKAYKTLVKKYHPDLQENELKIKYEEKIKKINEAYEVLSNPEKRKNYNLFLKNNEITNEDYNNLYNENINLKNEINYLKNNYNQMQNNYNHFENNKNQINNNIINENEINKKINNAVNHAYYDAYIQDLKNRGYKIKYKKTFKDFLALFLTIIFIIIISFILWHIPFTKNYLINLYNENPALKFIIDLFLNIFK